MTDYTSIADSQIDPKAPVTSELMTALRDNPIAISEGSSGAPKIKPEALNIYLGDGASSGTTTGTTNILTVTDLDALDYVLVSASSTLSTDNSIIASAAYSTSTNNGVSFGSSIKFAVGNGTGSFSGAAIVDCSGSINSVRISFAVTESGSSTWSVNSYMIGVGVE